MADADIPRRIRLRYPAVCVRCALDLSVGSEAFWDRETKTATCVACMPADGTPEAGRAGASAGAIGDARVARRVEDVRRRYGDHAARVAAKMVRHDPTIAAWEKGSGGESRLAAFVEREVGDQVIALHDRLIPGLKANIDHLFVAPTGVWVVDSKAYKGKVTRRDVGPLWRSEYRLFVGGRDRSDNAVAVERQVEAVIAALRDDELAKGTHVHGCLCLVDSDWGLFDFPFQVGAVWVLYAGALRRRLKRDGPLSRERMEHVARRLDISLPVAT